MVVLSNCYIVLNLMPNKTNAAACRDPLLQAAALSMQAVVVLYSNSRHYTS